MKPKNKSLLFLYPFLIALASSLSLYVHNSTEVAFVNVARTLIIIALLTLFINLVNLLIFRKAETARVITSMVMLFLVNYGDLSAFYQKNPIFGINLGNYEFLITTFILLIAITIMLFLKNTKIRKTIDQFFGLASLAFLAILLINYAQFLINSTKFSTRSTATTTAIPTSELNNDNPDIYFIIMDAYTSSDVLQSSFNFDNSEFEELLTDLGFYIPEKSYSNYDATPYMLSSALNMDFVQSFTDPNEYDPTHQAITEKSIHNEVRNFLAAHGYKISTFSSEYFWLMWRDADNFLEPVRKNFMAAGLNQFEFMALKKSVFNILYEVNPTIFDVLFFHIGKVGQDKYQEQNFLIENLSEVPDDGSPKFIYAHSTITHYPFLFHADGSMIALEDQGSSAEDRLKPNIQLSYIETIRYANSKLVPELQSIIESNPNSIIIVEGDHGYREADPNAIFFAIYDPGGSLRGQSCITPINLFRRIFNTWFGTNYEYLPDEVFVTPDQSYYRFESRGTCENIN